MGDVRVVESCRDVQRVQHAGGRRVDTNQQPVDGVVEGLVTVDLRTDAVVADGESVVAGVGREPLISRRVEPGFLERVGRRCHGRQRVIDHRVFDDRRSRVDHGHRRGRFVAGDASPAEPKFGAGHIVDEDAFFVVASAAGGTVEIAAEFQPAPIARGGVLRNARKRVDPDRFVLQRRHDDVGFRRAQNLQRRQGPVVTVAAAADCDFRIAEFQQRPGVDHHRDAAGDFQVCTVPQHTAAGAADADVVRTTVVRRGHVAVVAAAGEDPDDVTGAGGIGGQIDPSQRAGQGPVAAGDRRVAVDVNCPRVGGQIVRGGAEPEIEVAAGDPVGVAVEQRAVDVGQSPGGGTSVQRDPEVVSSFAASAGRYVAIEAGVGFVPGRADPDDIGAGVQLQVQRGVFAERIVVAPDQCVDRRTTRRGRWRHTEDPQRTVEQR